MVPQSKVIQILNILEKEYPDARVTLNFQNPLQLLVATILAAQCTDERVNQVTKDLFKKYRSAQNYAQADLKELEEEIRPTGFYHQKALHLIQCGQTIVEKFRGQVPRSLEKLASLPGVGRKTANILLGNAFGEQAIAVDTHVKRLAYRLGWTKSTDPDKIELDLQKLIPQNRWTQSCHQLVFHGRKICLAKKPLCSSCPIGHLCPRLGI
ncbi:MAG: endonuclease III [Thermodesulfobacteriota bacterium]